MSEIGPADYIHEFVSEAQRILDHAQEAAKHYADGDAAGAALVLGLVHYKFSAAEGAAAARHGRDPEAGRGDTGRRVAARRGGVTPGARGKRAPMY